MNGWLVVSHAVVWVSSAGYNKKTQYFNGWKGKSNIYELWSKFEGSLHNICIRFESGRGTMTPPRFGRNWIAPRKDQNHGTLDLRGTAGTRKHCNHALPHNCSEPYTFTDLFTLLIVKLLIYSGILNLFYRYNFIPLSSTYEMRVTHASPTCFDWGVVGNTDWVVVRSVYVVSKYSEPLKCSSYIFHVDRRKRICARNVIR